MTWCGSSYHTPNSWGVEAGRLLWVQDSLSYTMSFRFTYYFIFLFKSFCFQLGVGSIYQYPALRRIMNLRPVWTIWDPALKVLETGLAALELATQTGLASSVISNPLPLPVSPRAAPLHSGKSLWVWKKWLSSHDYWLLFSEAGFSFQHPQGSRIATPVIGGVRCPLLAFAGMTYTWCTDISIGKICLDFKDCFTS